MTDSPDTTDDTTDDTTGDTTTETTESQVLGLPDAPSYTLQQFPEKLAVIKLPPGAEIPDWAESSSLFSITATATETSLVCAGRSIPTKVTGAKGLTAFALMGELDHKVAGVLVELLAPLAEDEISVFTISTHDTNWFLVPVTDAEKTAEAWRRRGHTVALAVPVKPPRKTKKK